MARRTIEENGMSMKLVEFCNKSNIFLEEFIKLIPNYPVKKEGSEERKEVEYIDFTGDYETGFGKPDITIRFTDGTYFFIEVKTNKSTGFQENQVKGGYLGLIKSLGQSAENSFAFLLDPTHNLDKEDYDASNDTIKIKGISIPIFYWSAIYKLVKNMGNDSFARDIEDNVDGIASETENLSLTANEYDLLKLENKMLYTINNIKNIDVSNCSHNNLTLEFSTDVKEYGITLGKYYNLINGNNAKHDILLKDKIYIGYNPSLLKDGYIVEKHKDLDINKCLYCIAVYYDVLVKDEYQNNKYCIDKYRWVYFPLEKTEISENNIKSLLDKIMSDYIPSDIRTLKPEEIKKKSNKNDCIQCIYYKNVCNEDVCNAYSIIEKVSKLLVRTSDKINSKLQTKCPALYTGSYWSGFFKNNDYYCTKEINGQTNARNQNKANGNSSTIFYGLRIFEQFEDYPLVVCLNEKVCNTETMQINDQDKENKTEGYRVRAGESNKDVDGYWYYFKIDVSILASNSYEEDFVNKVVEIISTYYNGK